jgi:hypothetical protein
MYDGNSLTVQPGFYDVDTDDLHLASGSPMIDAGQVLPAVQEDGDGESRPADGDGDLNAVHDIGYDEYVDTDGDTIPDTIEDAGCTDKQDPDTDRDGLPDGWEVRYDLNPCDGAGDNGADGDPDGDGYTNMQEFAFGSDPRDPLYHPDMPPVITGRFPGGNQLFIVEFNSIEFSVSAEDGDGDPISYEWQLDGVSKSTSDRWTLTTDDESSGQHLVEAFVRSATDEVSTRWTVSVSNLNRPPMIDPASIPDRTVVIPEVVDLSGATAEDPDNENGVTNDDNTLNFAFSGWMNGPTKQTQPGDEGIHTVTLTVVDNGSPPLSDSKAIVIEVLAPTATPEPTSTENPTITPTMTPTWPPGQFLIAGKIVYHSSPSGAAVTGVTVACTSGHDVISNASGEYSIGPLDSGGTYTITPSKGAEDVNTAITISDVELIAMATIGMASLTAEQRIAADVDGDGEVTVVDARLVMKYVHGLIDLPFPSG